MKIVLQHSAHDAIRCAGEGVNQAGLHVVHVCDRLPPGGLVREHCDGQLDVGVVEV